MNEALRPDDTRDALRKLGGVAFGVGALMLFFRKQEEWADLPLFLTYAIPAIILYGGALAARNEVGGVRSWQAVYSVFGLGFLTLALIQLVDMIGDPGDSGKALNVFWIFAVTAAAAFYAGLVAGIRFQLLAGGIALIVSWMALWDKILSDGLGAHLGVTRGLFGLVAIGLIVLGIVIWRGDRDRDRGVFRFSELFTAAGIAAVIAGGISITAIFGELAQSAFFPISISAAESSLFWEVVLLLVSLGLIGVGSLIGTRGPVYIGAIGLVLFLFIAGQDLNDETPDTKVVGWPLILLIGGGLAILASLVRDLSLGDGPRRLVDQLSGRSSPPRSM